MIYTLCPFCEERIERGDDGKWPACKCGAIAGYIGEGAIKGVMWWEKQSEICEESEVEE